MTELATFVTADVERSAHALSGQVLARTGMGDANLHTTHNTVTYSQTDDIGVRISKFIFYIIDFNLKPDLD